MNKRVKSLSKIGNLKTPPPAPAISRQPYAGKTLCFCTFCVIQLSLFVCLGESVGLFVFSFGGYFII